MSIEVVEISDNNNNHPPVNFGVGVDLLMNDKKKQTTPKSFSLDNNNRDVTTKESSIGDMDKLEEDLNNLTGLNKNNNTMTDIPSIKLNTKPMDVMKQIIIFV